MSEVEKKSAQHDEDNFSGPKFNPPLYRQRYQFVYDTLFKQVPAVVRVADFGCAEGRFIPYMKRLPFAEEMSVVDVEKPALDECIYQSRPMSWDYVFGRNVAMNFNIYHGSVCERDFRLKNLDAITMIELIEHLEPHILEKMPENVFGYLTPKLVILTTPNSEFNKLFPQLKDGGYRHWDHKFEWTRDEFKQWCETVAKNFPDYSYELFGIGDALPQSENLGSCSQGAVFKRLSNKVEDVALGAKTPLNYHLYESFTYPKRTHEEKPFEVVDWDAVINVSPSKTSSKSDENGVENSM